MRIGAGCGCLSIIIGVAALLLIFVLPSVMTDNTGLNQLMGSIFCGDADAYVNESQSYSYRPGETSYTLQAGCRKTEGGKVEDVTNTQALVGFGVFTLGLLGGIWLIIMSSVRGAPRGITALTTALGSSLVYDGKRQGVNLTKAPPTDTVATSDNNNLSERLRELEASYQEGLINREEYDDARKRILQNL